MHQHPPETSFDPLSESLSEKQAFLNDLQEVFSESNRDFARAYYLFATAKLHETYDSQAIYAKYPVLSEESTFLRLKQHYDEAISPGPHNAQDDKEKQAKEQHEVLKRLFTSVFGTYIAAKLAEDSDAFENLKNQLKVQVKDLGLRTEQGEPVESLLYEDVAEWLKKTADHAQRRALYHRMAQAYTETLSPRFLDLLGREIQLFRDLGYPDLIDFYTRTSGHDLRQLAKKGEELLAKTHDLYYERMGAFYHQRTGLDFEQDAVRADISFVLHGPSTQLEAILPYFSADKLVPLARQTFDGLGLNFSTLAEEVQFKDKAHYESVVMGIGDKIPKGGGDFNFAKKGNQSERNILRRILLDTAHRPGKDSRAYVYPAAVPSEIYLSVKPTGGLDDYVTFFHESGHAQHFAWGDPGLSFAMALMGNNTTTETYAYLFQNLPMNRHWLEHQVGLSPEEAALVCKQRALADLYLLRRYAAKIQFEVLLFDQLSMPGSKSQESIVESLLATVFEKGQSYATLLSQGCGFRYEPEGWTRDVDAGFYVADYFTAWSLEAQLRKYLAEHYGSIPSGEDWYQNPQAGQFLKGLWHQGSITPEALSRTLGYDSPNDVGPLLEGIFHANH